MNDRGYSYPDSSNLTNQSNQELEKYQEQLCQSWKILIRGKSYEYSFLYFKQLFLEYQQYRIISNTDINQKLTQIIQGNNYQIFQRTFRRCCYILIHNLLIKKKDYLIVKLPEILTNYRQKQASSRNYSSFSKRKLNSWLVSFIDSKAYQELQLFSLNFQEQSAQSWFHRHIDYLFFLQYIDKTNPQEQRDTALLMLKRLKKDFKYNLAMYLAKCQSGNYDSQNDILAILPEEVLRFVKLIAIRKGRTSHQNIALLFLQQTQEVNYLYFKTALQKYIIFSLSETKIVTSINNYLSRKIDSLYPEYNERQINQSLTLRTCNKIFDYLTINQAQPSELFVLFMSQGNPYTVVIILLKLILISPNSQNHLDTKIGELIQYYSQSPASECKWLLKLIDIFKVTFAIYADKDVKYNLLKVKTDLNYQSISDLDSYHLLLQYKDKDKGKKK